MDRSVLGCRRGLTVVAALLVAGGLLVEAQAPAAARVTKVVGDKHRLGLFSDGRVVGWRQFANGQLGPIERITAPGRYTLGPIPQELPGKAIDLARRSSTAVRTGRGACRCRRRSGSPRRPTSRSRWWPTVTAITGGLTGRHTLALLKDGSLRGWGNTDWGQVGAGVSGTYQPKPATPRIAGVQAVFAAGNNTYAVKADGSFWGWGNGGSGEWPFVTPIKAPTAIDLK
jgi:alpha-tubulin suppressor-like RCC1 family protein